MNTIKTQQILVPRKVYIGDPAELRCTFSSESEEFKILSEVGAKKLNINLFNEELNFSEYDIQNIQISQNGINYYQFTITFVPWKTGKIQFPAYKITESLNPEVTEKSVIMFEPINIVSITENNNSITVQPLTNPLLLPGTIYKLYGVIVSAIILLVLFIRIGIKRREIAFYFRSKKILRFYKKNKKNTIKLLQKLQLQQTGNKEFAAELQAILRKYLEKRFDYPFTKTVSSEIMQSLNKATNFMLSDEKLDAGEELARIFIRTDFIRYGQNSFEYGTIEVTDEEKSDLINSAITNIEKLEEEEKPEKNEGSVK